VRKQFSALGARNFRIEDARSRVPFGARLGHDPEEKRHIIG
jgi:hypothetical protein